MIALSAHLDSSHIGRDMHALATELYPICRSMTGPGVRQTLERLTELAPLKICEVPTGTQVFDWEVPREWIIRDAFIKDESGQRVVDFQQSNLHVVGYSTPIRTRLRWSELKTRLRCLVDHPEWIPYRNSFHADDWGFCLSYRQFQQLEARGDRLYDVCIDSSLIDGSLTYGEMLLPGHTSDEVLISTHVCHPSLANDNLSGIAVATYLARELAERTRRFSYRFLFIPATIGAITWLFLNRDRVAKIKHGLVLSGVGDAGSPTYKRSRQGHAEIDRAFAHVLQQTGKPSTIRAFEPFGYDERHFCSPGFNLPMGCLMRTPNQAYPEYHTSADNLEFINADSLADSWSLCVSVIDVLEGNRRYVNRFPYGEPRLGPRGLYQGFGAGVQAREIHRALMWTLNFSDGDHTLLEIAERSELPFGTIRQAADSLCEHGLLTALENSHTTHRRNGSRLPTSICH